MIPIKWKDHDRINTPTGANSGKSKFYMSKYYKFEDLRVCYKRFPTITFNKYMMGIVSKSIHQWYKNNGASNIDDILCIIPVVMKPLAAEAKDIIMDNCTAGVTFKFPLRSNLKDAISLTSSRFDSYFNMYFLMHVIFILKTFMIVPSFIGRFLYHTICGKLDLTLTNLSGYREQIYLCDRKLKSLYGFLGVYCKSNLTMVVSSFNYKVSIQIAADANLQMDPQKLMDLIERNLDIQIENSDIE